MRLTKKFLSAERRTQFLIISLVLLLLTASRVAAQSPARNTSGDANKVQGGESLKIFGAPSVFTYQGRLSDAGGAANGIYNMQFKLYDAATDGSQLPSGGPITQELANVQVTNGVFTVQLDFGSAAFSGSLRYLEIGVRHAGAGEQYTTLAPRHVLTSTPYAIRSDSSSFADFATSSAQLNGIPASQYVKTDDTRMTDARTPTSGSNSYIQNTTKQQASADFNIGGNGTLGGTLTANTVSAASFIGDAASVKTVNVTTQYSFNNQRVLTANGGNLTVGIGAGHISGGGSFNSFFGNNAGTEITTGNNNSFFGESAGKADKAGQMNSFFGSGAGSLNATGDENSFFGASAGSSNTAGSNNSFFGAASGEQNTTGTGNAFFGYNTGANNKTGFNNSYFGSNTGTGPFGGSGTGSYNAFFGTNAGTLNTANGNSFFGALAGRSNTTGNENVFFGANAGMENVDGYFNIFVGSDSGRYNTAGSSNIFLGRRAGLNNKAGSANIVIGTNAGSGKGTQATESNVTLLGNASNITPGVSNSTAIGANALVTQSNSLVLGDSSVSVGIGTTAPKSRLQVNGGNIYLGDAGQGIILKSPNGSTCRLLTISDAGTMTLTVVACP